MGGWRREVGFCGLGNDTAMRDYAGDIPPTKAWEILTNDRRAALIDVRTVPEWNFVGVPDLSGLNKNVALISWQNFPDMARNDEFETAVEALGVAKDSPLLFLCRSGARSRAAAIAMTARGYKACYNVAEGFEGDVDAAHHRGSKNGWKVAGLPWVQR